jgi:outer membrane lipoprotein-sorting protein
MQKIIRLGLLSIAFTFVFGLVGATVANAQVTTQILNRMEAHRNSLSSLKANVVMEKTDTTLDETDTTEGSVIYLPQSGKNDYVRIDWNRFQNQPYEESMAVVKGNYIIYTPARKQALCGSTDSVGGNGKANNALSFMSMSKAELRANYDVRYMGKSKVDGAEVAYLKLIPKKQTKYKGAEIWVDADGMPRQAKVMEGNGGDTTMIRLSKIQKNVKVNGSDFKISLPKGMKCTRG